jgi:hypothetical protein
MLYRTHFSCRGSTCSWMWGTLKYLMLYRTHCWVKPLLGHAEVLHILECELHILCSDAEVYMFLNVQELRWSDLMLYRTCCWVVKHAWLAVHAVEVGGLQALGWLSPPSTLENREFIKNTIKQNCLTTFSWSRIKTTKMASLINGHLILFQCFMKLWIYALYFRTSLTLSYDFAHFVTISRIYARQESLPSGKFSSTALMVRS